MEREKYFEDDEIVLVPPYWWVEYLDDWGHKHIATIKNKGYLFYIETRFTILSKKIILP